MRLCRPLRRNAILSLVLVAGVILLLRHRLLETRRDSITREILTALGSRNTSTQVNANVSTTVINSRRCRPDTNQYPLLALVVIIGKPDEIQSRKLSREYLRSWNGNFNSVQLIFFVGLPKDNNYTSILKESELYDDIVMEAMEESYYSLTLKTLRMLKWFLSSCSSTSVKYLVKSDTDTFIHLPNLVEYLYSVDRQGPNVADRFIGGDIAVNAHPIFDPMNKWYMPPELLESVHQDPGSPYPNYALGGFYVLSSALIPALFRQSLKVPLIQFEDVFLTGLVANKGMGINLTKIPLVFSGFYKKVYSYLFTSYYNDSIIASHLQGDLDTMEKYYVYHQKNYANSLKSGSYQLKSQSTVKRYDK